MLFQGEEWAASTPFAFFTSHPEPELGRATAEGRLAEFERMGWDPAVVPDPQDPATYERSKLDWDELGTGRHAVLLDVYRRLGALRRELPELTDPDLRRVDVDVDEDARTLVMRRGAVTVVVNVGGRPGRASSCRASTRCCSRRRPARRPSTGASRCPPTRVRCCGVPADPRSAAPAGRAPPPTAVR